jgi:hypothetical protein
MAVEKNISDIDIEVEGNPFETDLTEENPMFEGIPTEQLPDYMVEDEDGGVTIDLEPQMDLDLASALQNHDANLAEVLDDRDLARIAGDLLDGYDNDRASREEWEQSYVNGLDLLGFKYEERTEPFEGASGVTHPLLAEAVTQFQAQAYKELLPAGGPVRTQVVGLPTPERVAQADRVKEYMNYQIVHVMDEYDPDMDQMLFHLPLAGSTFKKVYFDESKGRAVSSFVPVENLVVSYSATDIASAERVTHVLNLTANELRQNQVYGFYRDIDLSPSQITRGDIGEAEDEAEGVRPGASDEAFTVLEVHTYLDIPGFEDKGEDGEPTGIALPYIVTIDEDSAEILSIRRNWREGDLKRMPVQYFTHYKFLPGLGFYGLGLVHMIGGLSRAATSLLRQLIDAGTFSNLPAGFKTRGVRIADSDVPLQPGEFRDMDAPGGDLRQAIMPLPYKEPSPTLSNLLGFLVGAGQRFAAIADMQVGEGNQMAAVGTTMAMMERGTKVMSAIHKRLYNAQKIEFKILARIFRDTTQQYPYEVVGVQPQAAAQDFDDRVDILPVADPNIYSMAQRVTLAQSQLQLAQSNPQMHNMHEAFRRMYEALGVQNIEMILPPPPKPTPSDPAEENSRALMGQPIQAHEAEDHDAHMAAHLAMMQAPLVQAVPQVMANLMGNIMQHISMKARAMAQQEMQQQQMPQQQPNPQMEAQVLARASQIASQMTSELVQSLTPQQQGDPLVMLRAQELALKERDLQRKEREFQQNLMLKKQDQDADRDVQRERIQTTEDIAQLRANIALEKMNRAQGNQGGY